eukprot:6674382-Pyramimonas_sp.AAC.1
MPRLPADGAQGSGAGGRHCHLRGLASWFGVCQPLPESRAVPHPGPYLVVARRKAGDHRVRGRPGAAP